MPGITFDELRFMVACLVGASVRAIRDDKTKFSQKVTEIFCGMTTAYYFTPPIASRFELVGDEKLLAAFVFGFVAMEFAGIVISFLREFGVSILKEAVRKMLRLDK